MAEILPAAGEHHSLAAFLLTEPRVHRAWPSATPPRHPGMILAAANEAALTISSDKLGLVCRRSAGVPRAGLGRVPPQGPRRRLSRGADLDGHLVLDGHGVRFLAGPDDGWQPMGCRSHQALYHRLRGGAVALDGQRVRHRADFLLLPRASGVPASRPVLGHPRRARHARGNDLWRRGADPPV